MVDSTLPEKPKGNLLKKDTDEKSEGGQGSDFISEDDFNQLPPSAKETVSRMISMFMSGPAPHPIISKMNTEQVGKVIDNIENDSIREHEDRMSSRKWNFAAMVVILFFIVVLAFIFLWKDKSEYIAPIITALIGGIGGYGFGFSHGQKKS